MSEEKQVELFPVFDTLDRLIRQGHRVIQPVSNGSFYLANADGQLLASGRSFRDLCVNIVLAGL
jgi:hypothetical protein